MEEDVRGKDKASTRKMQFPDDGTRETSHGVCGILTQNRDLIKQVGERAGADSLHQRGNSSQSEVEYG